MRWDNMCDAQCSSWDTTAAQNIAGNWWLSVGSSEGQGLPCRKMALVDLVDPAGLRGDPLPPECLCSGLAEGCVLLIWKLQAGGSPSTSVKGLACPCHLDGFCLFCCLLLFWPPQPFLLQVGSEFLLLLPSPSLFSSFRAEFFHS